MLLSIASAASESPTATEAELTHPLHPWQAVLDAATPDGIPLTKTGWMAAGNYGVPKGAGVRHLARLAVLAT